MAGRSNPNQADVLLDDSVHCGQAKTGALAFRFGGVKRLERCGTCSGAMPSLVSPTASSTYSPAGTIE